MMSGGVMAKSGVGGGEDGDLPDTTWVSLHHPGELELWESY